MEFHINLQKEQKENKTFISFSHSLSLQIPRFKQMTYRYGESAADKWFKQHLTSVTSNKDHKTKTTGGSFSPSPAAVSATTSNQKPQPRKEEKKKYSAIEEGSIKEGESLTECAFARVLDWAIQKRVTNYPVKTGEFMLRYPLHETVFVNNLKSSKSKLRMVNMKPTIVFQPLNVSADEKFYTKHGKVHDHTQCFKKGAAPCPYLCGNHWVAVVIDSRPEAAAVANIHTGSHPSVFPEYAVPKHQQQQQQQKQPTYGGLVLYWDSLGSRMFSPELRSALKSCYPTLRLIEINERLQDDGYQCPMWTALYFHCYLDHIQSPPPSSASSPTLCTVLGKDVDHQLRRLTFNSSLSDSNANQSYIQSIRTLAAQALSNPAKTDEVSSTLLNNCDFE